MVNVSEKDTIYNLKQKIVEYLEFGNNASRKIKLIKLKEFITLDDKRLIKNEDPKELFNYEDLDKPFQILDDYFTVKDENLKEFPLDIIVILNSDSNIHNAVLDKKDKESVVMAPHEPITPVIRESNLVRNNSSILVNKNQIIDPSVFPSPPSFTSDSNVKGKNNYRNKQIDLSNINIDDDIVPRSKSIIFNIDRFPSPPSDDNSNVNNQSNNNNKASNEKYTVYDIDQFPDAPVNEDSSFTSKAPLTYTEEAPPSYDVISNKNIPLNNNIYTNSSDINNQIIRDPNQLGYNKNKSKSIRRSIIISTCLCLGVMITTLLAIIVGKSLLQKREPMQKGKTQFVKIGEFKTYRNPLNQPVTSINVVTTTVNYLPTYSFKSFRTFENKEQQSLESFVDVKSGYQDKDNYLTFLQWKMDMSEESPRSDLAIKNNPENSNKKRSNDYININDDSNEKEIQTNNKIARAVGVDEKDKINSDNSNNDMFKIDSNFNFTNMFEEIYKNGNNNDDSNINYLNHMNENNNEENNEENNNERTDLSKKDDDESNANKTDKNKNEADKKSVDQDHQKLSIDNDLTLDLGIRILRIIEINDNNTISQSFIDFTKENLSKNETPINIVNNSKNTKSGLIEVKKIYGSIDTQRRIVVMSKTYSGDQKDEFNMSMNPSMLRWYITIEDFKQQNPNAKLQLEIEIKSSKYFWSDVNEKTIYFDKSQCVIQYGESIDYFNSLKLEGDKDIISGPTTDQPLVVRFDINTDMYKAKENTNMGFDMFRIGAKKIIGFSVKADMNTYNALNRLTSSSLSFRKFNCKVGNLACLKMLLNI